MAENYRPLDRSKLSQTFGAFERPLPKCPYVRARSLMPGGYKPSYDAVCPVLPHERREQLIKHSQQAAELYNKFSGPIQGVYNVGRITYNHFVARPNSLPQLPHLRHEAYLDSIFLQK
jgi:hypothetical protein